MRAFCFFLICVSSHLALTAQVALVRDPDGFVNVRSAATTASSISDTLLNERLVFSFEEGSSGQWLQVDYNKNGEQRSGFIHQTRLVFLEKLLPFPVTAKNDTLIVFKRDTMKLTFGIGKFEAGGRKIQYANTGTGNQYITKVDGKTAWGIDGHMPRYEYKSIQFIAGSKRIKMTDTIFRDLFEPNIEAAKVFWDPSTKRVYPSFMNSDAAGAYLVVWIFNSERFLGREIFIPF